MGSAGILPARRSSSAARNARLARDIATRVCSPSRSATSAPEGSSPSLRATRAKGKSGRDRARSWGAVSVASAPGAPDSDATPASPVAPVAPDAPWDVGPDAPGDDGSGKCGDIGFCSFIPRRYRVTHSGDAHALGHQPAAPRRGRRRDPRGVGTGRHRRRPRGIDEVPLPEAGHSDEARNASNACCRSSG